MRLLVVTIATSFSLGLSDEVAFRVSTVAALLLLALLVVALRRLLGTTLVAPCGWAIASTVALGVLMWEHYSAADGTTSSLRFSAVALTFCPLMAVLGAKRPQDKGWQWVVASLWLVLVWPAGYAMLAGTELELFIAWKLFLVGLIVVGLLNYLPTRHWLASLLVAAGQSALIAEFVWTERQFDPGEMMNLAMLLFLAAGLLVWWRSRARFSDAEEKDSSLADYDRRWLRFRDAYGAFWALRVLGRVNETAGLQNWPSRLEWQGFVATDKQPTEEQLQEIDQCWTTLMRRFW